MYGLCWEPLGGIPVHALAVPGSNACLRRRRSRSSSRKSTRRRHNKSLQLSAWVQLAEKECGPLNRRMIG
jgi:hypothetical protein